MQQRSQRAGGAYLLHIRLLRTLRLKIGALGEHLAPAGHYVYIGSARRGIATRVARHMRLALTKSGKLHWHIDHLLIRRECELSRTRFFPGVEECALARRVARRVGAIAPVPRFGASDCRSGCLAHLYRISRLIPPAHEPSSHRKRSTGTASRHIQE